MSRLVTVGFGLLVVAAALVSSSGVTSAQETVTVPVGDIWFCDESYEGGVCPTEIEAGDTILWDFSGAELPHSATACGASCDSPTASPLWDSGVLTDGSYQFTFDEPGTYLYYCTVHPALQRGRIVVTGAQEPSPTATVVPGATQAPDGDATPGPVVPPAVGTGRSDTTSNWWWYGAALAGFGLVLAAAGLLARRRIAQ